jgi:hypothetical protein
MKLSGLLAYIIAENAQSYVLLNSETNSPNLYSKLLKSTKISNYLLSIYEQASLASTQSLPRRNDIYLK